MLGLAAPTLIAIIGASLLGGTPRRLLNTTIRGWPVIVAAFVVELVLYSWPVDCQSWALLAGPQIWSLTRVALLAGVGLNVLPGPGRLSWPWVLVTLGVGLNALVIVLNGGHMPQSPEAAMAVWGGSHLDPSRLQNVAVSGPESRLAWLGDVLPQPRWLPRANVVSPGDILLALGAAAWVVDMSFANRSVASPLTVWRRIVA